MSKFTGSIPSVKMFFYYNLKVSLLRKQGFWTLFHQMPSLKALLLHKKNSKLVNTYTHVHIYTWRKTYQFSSLKGKFSIIILWYRLQIFFMHNLVKY